MTLNHTPSNVPHIYVTSNHESKISLRSALRPDFSPFHSAASLLRIICHFETSAPNDPKWHWALQGQLYLIYVSLVSPIPKFQSVLLYKQPFLSYRPFWQKSALIDPKMTLNPTRSNFPEGPNFTPLYSTMSCFLNRGHFGKVHWMTSKWHWTLQGQMYPIHVPLVWKSPKLQFVSLYDKSVSRYRPFWDKCIERPQNDLDTTKSKVHYIRVTNILENQSSPNFPLRPTVSEIHNCR